MRTNHGFFSILALLVCIISLADAAPTKTPKGKKAGGSTTAGGTAGGKAAGGKGTFTLKGCPGKVWDHHNTYPSYNEDLVADDLVRASKKGYEKMPHFNFKTETWKVKKLNPVSEVGKFKRAMSNYVQWDNGFDLGKITNQYNKFLDKKTQAELDQIFKNAGLPANTPLKPKGKWPSGFDIKSLKLGPPTSSAGADADNALKIKYDNGMCPITGFSDWKEPRFGFDLSTFTKHKRWDESAGWYATEHVYEKQLIQEYFDYVLYGDWLDGNPIDVKQPKTTGAKAPKKQTIIKGHFDCDWLHSLAHDNLYGNSVINNEPVHPYTFQPKRFDMKTDQFVDNTQKKIEKERTNLVAAMGGMIGSYDRIDLFAALETNVNGLKGRMFDLKTPYAIEAFQGLGRKECVKNPRMVIDDAGADPSEKTVLQDRVNLIKQVVIVYQYLFEQEDVWGMFARTSNNMYTLINDFQSHLDLLQEAKATDDVPVNIKKYSGKAVSPQWVASKKEAKLTDPRFAAAGKFPGLYKKFLTKHISAMLKVTDDWFAKIQVELRDNKDIYNGDDSVYTKKVQAEIKEVLDAYSGTAFRTAVTKLVEDTCFDKHYMAGEKLAARLPAKFSAATFKSSIVF